LVYSIATPFLLLEEDEIEEEEQLVFVEFQGLPDQAILRQRGTCTLLVNKRTSLGVMPILVE